MFFGADYDPDPASTLLENKLSVVSLNAYFPRLVITTDDDF